jgi:hypothetical protein
MKTWRKYRAYKRIQTLWEEYKVSAKSDKTRLDVKLDKLSEFLDSFQQTYAEFKAPSNHGVSLDSFYGDCSEVLVSLLDLVHRSVTASYRNYARFVDIHLLSFALSA